MPDALLALPPSFFAWFTVVNTLVLVVIALLGLRLKNEFLEFKEKHVMPLRERLEEESHERQLDLQKVSGVLDNMADTVDELREFGKTMSANVVRDAEERARQAERIHYLSNEQTKIGLMLERRARAREPR